MNEPEIHSVSLPCICPSAGIIVNPALGQIQGRGKTLSLSPVNMKVLVVLLDNAGKVVSRAAIYEQVWGNQIVSDDALTRCISDLRTLLKTVSSDALIETLPKRGYRWLPEVRQVTGVHEPEFNLPEESQAITREEEKPAQSSFRSSGLWMVAGFALLFILYSAFIGYPGRSPDPGYIQLALMPVQVGSQEQQGLGSELEDELRKQLLDTGKLRFLSRNSMNGFQESPYSRLFNELGTQWVIEIQVRQRRDTIVMSLSLVDARTSLVTYMESAVFSGEVAELERLCSTFITGMSALLGAGDGQGAFVGLGVGPVVGTLVGTLVGSATP